jgi:hypothetical protein
MHVGTRTGLWRFGLDMGIGTHEYTMIYDHDGITFLFSVAFKWTTYGE